MRQRGKLFRRIGLTREGWLFIVVLGFITVGAVLRNVNLLILTAGLMFAPLIVNWRLGVLRLKTLSAQRSLPNRIHAGRLASFQWICQNDSKLAAWNVEVRDLVVRDFPETEGREVPQRDRRFAVWRWLLWMLKLDRFVRSNARAAWLQIPPGKSEVSSYRVYFAERGRYRVGPAKLQTSFPFGLISSQINLFDEEHFFVAPQLGRLNPHWEQRVRSSVVGSDAIKRRRGFEEDEFYALRPWRSGDSKKNIHWRTSARFGQPIVRQHDQQDNRDFAMLLDLHADVSADAGNDVDRNETLPRSATSQACEDALKFGATVLMQLGNAVQGRAAFAICGETSVVCGSRSRRETVNEAMKQMAIARPAKSPSIVDALLQLSALVSPSTPLYVFSSRSLPDGFDDQALIVAESAGRPIATDAQPDSSPAGSSSSMPSRTARRLNSIWSSIRWVSIDSDEFRAIFADETNGQDQSIRTIANKWNSQNVTN